MKPKEFEWTYQQLVRNAAAHFKREGLGYRSKQACARAAGTTSLHNALISELGEIMKANPAMTVEAAMEATGNTTRLILDKAYGAQRVENVLGLVSEKLKRDFPKPFPSSSTA